MRLWGESMKRIKNGIVTTILLLISGFALPANSGSLRQTKDVPTVFFADLIKYPERYDQKEVRLFAMYKKAFIDSFLYDKSLVERKGAKDVAAQKLLLQIGEENWDKIIKEVDEKFPVGQCDRAEVEVIGKFKIRKTTYPYGDSVKYSFVVLEFEQVKCLSKKSRGIGGRITRACARPLIRQPLIENLTVAELDGGG